MIEGLELPALPEDLRNNDKSTEGSGEINSSEISDRHTVETNIRNSQLIEHEWRWSKLRLDLTTVR